MKSERTQAPYGLWKVDSHPAVIEYSNPVMSEIAAFATDGLQRLARGGIEVGGILYGSRSGAALRIEAWRPIVCEHARGPSFLLSEKDEKALEKLLGDCESDPGLKGYEALGWFHSHTRSEICLTGDDLQIYDRYFAEPWQVALVIRPKRFEHVRAGFFVRESNGPVRSGSSLLEFVIEPGTRAVVPPPRSAPVEIVPKQPVPDPLPPERKVQSPLWPRLLAMAAVVLVILATAKILTTKWRSDSERPVILPLKVSDQLGTLQIEWDRSFKQVLEADSGEILISDGPRVVTKNLDGAAVHQGGFQFVRGSEDVRIQLTLFRGGKPTAKEISVFVGPKIIRAKDATPDRSGRQLQRFADENVRLRDALKKETARSQRLDRTVRQLQDRLANRK